ncbi:alpha/beta hydrolase, partial [Brevibacillus sp. SIMBA_076]
DDVLEILEALDLRDVVFVGHSVSSMIGVLAANRSPERFGRLVLVGPSPRYIDDADYLGGFTRADIDGLLDALDVNYLGWSEVMAP